MYILMIFKLSLKWIILCVLSIIECSGCSLGFEECSSTTCKDSCGEIASLNFPADYPNNKQCKWEILVSSDNFIEIDFLYFDIVSQNRFCLEDYLSVTDVDISGNLVEVGRFCNRNQPRGKIRSSWNRLIITFTTDGNEKGGGFHATYKELSYDGGSKSFNGSCS